MEGYINGAHELYCVAPSFGVKGRGQSVWGRRGEPLRASSFYKAHFSKWYWAAVIELVLLISLRIMCTELHWLLENNLCLQCLRGRASNKSVITYTPYWVESPSRVMRIC